MSDNVFATFFITFLAGASTAIGAALTFVIKRDDFRWLALGMSFSAGVMLYLSFMDILPISFSQIAGDGADWLGIGVEKTSKIAGMAAFFLGAAAAALIDAFIPSHVHSDMLSAASQEPSQKGGRLNRMAVITAVAISIHNFPEGLSVFVTGLEDINVGMAVGFAIMLHNIPEGISVSLPVYTATGSKGYSFMVGALSGLTEPLGAIVAYLFLAPLLTNTVIGCVLASTAGIMVYIALDELLPMAREYGEEHYGIFGAFAGMGVMVLGSLVF